MGTVMVRQCKTLDMLKDTNRYPALSRNDPQGTSRRICSFSTSFFSAERVLVPPLVLCVNTGLVVGLYGKGKT